GGSPRESADAGSKFPEGDLSGAQTVNADSYLLKKLFPNSADASPDGEINNFEGMSIGHFRLLSRLGVGGMGSVFLAEDEILRRQVALKVLSPGQSRDESSVARFRNEARAAATLDDEHIARVFSSGEDRGLYYIAYEYVEGRNLRDLIRQTGKLDPAEAIHYTLQMAAALTHLSAMNVVHRDIKPSNILITRSGKAKLVDLGLARCQISEESIELTVAGTTLGTFDYISPEQAKDPRTVDIRSDIYSLGCTVYHMLTGEPPYPEGTVLQKLLDHQGRESPDPAAKNSRVSPALSMLVRKMMASDRRKRYASGQELLRDLTLLARQMGLPIGGSVVALPPRTRLQDGVRQNAGWIATVCLLVLVVFLLDRFPNLLPGGPEGGSQRSTGASQRAGNPENVPGAQPAAPANSRNNGGGAIASRPVGAGSQLHDGRPVNDGRAVPPGDTLAGTSGRSTSGKNMAGGNAGNPDPKPLVPGTSPGGSDGAGMSTGVVPKPLELTGSEIPPSVLLPSGLSLGLGNPGAVNPVINSTTGLSEAPIGNGTTPGVAQRSPNNLPTGEREPTATPAPGDMPTGETAGRGITPPAGTATAGNPISPLLIPFDETLTASGWFDNIFSNRPRQSPPSIGDDTNTPPGTSGSTSGSTRGAGLDGSAVASREGGLPRAGNDASILPDGPNSTLPDRSVADRPNTERPIIEGPGVPLSPVTIVGGKSFESLEAACVSAKPGDVIELRYQGRQLPPEKPFRISGKSLTIRAARGYRPVIWFAPQDSLQSTMMTLSGGVVSLVNIDVELDLPQTVTADLWTLFATERIEKLMLQRVRVTVVNPRHAPVTVLRQATPAGQASAMISAMKTGIPSTTPETVVSGCIVRGTTRFCTLEDPSPSRYLIDDTLIAIDDDVFRTPGLMDVMAEVERVEISLNHATILTRQHFLMLGGGEDFTAVLTPISCNLRNSIFAVGHGKPLILQQGMAGESDLKRFLTWSGERNFYDAIEPFWQAGMASYKMRFDRWKQFWSVGGELSTSQNIPIEWRGRWMTKPFETIVPEDVELDATSDSNPLLNAATDGSDAGAPLTRLPSDTPPERAAPAPALIP
ncbi:MAG: hypothetical protein C0478_02515, partial [Planctomyces sp.]|nr:hypothetical protein [Planctomyces sp.]